MSAPKAKKAKKEKSKGGEEGQLKLTSGKASNSGSGTQKLTLEGPNIKDSSSDNGQPKNPNKTKTQLTEKNKQRLKNAGEEKRKAIAVKRGEGIQEESKSTVKSDTVSTNTKTNKRIIKNASNTTPAPDKPTVTTEKITTALQTVLNTSKIVSAIKPTSTTANNNLGLKNLFNNTKKRGLPEGSILNKAEIKKAINENYSRSKTIKQSTNILSKNSNNKGLGTFFNNAEKRITRNEKNKNSKKNIINNGNLGLNKLFEEQSLEPPKNTGKNTSSRANRRKARRNARTKEQNKTKNLFNELPFKNNSPTNIKSKQILGVSGESTTNTSEKTSKNIEGTTKDSSSNNKPNPTAEATPANSKPTTAEAGKPMTPNTTVEAGKPTTPNTTTEGTPTKPNTSTEAGESTKPNTSTEVGKPIKQKTAEEAAPLTLKQRKKLLKLKTSLQAQQKNILDKIERAKTMANKKPGIFKKFLRTILGISYRESIMAKFGLTTKSRTPEENKIYMTNQEQALKEVQEKLQNISGNISKKIQTINTQIGESQEGGTSKKIKNKKKK